VFICYRNQTLFNRIETNVMQSNFFQKFCVAQTNPTASKDKVHMDGLIEVYVDDSIQ